MSFAATEEGNNTLSPEIVLKCQVRPGMLQRF